MCEGNYNDRTSREYWNKGVCHTHGTYTKVGLREKKERTILKPYATLMEAYTDSLKIWTIWKIQKLF